ncbi:two-partner secretion domain-containing protein [Calothrix sp. NIES-3974]|uniref:two-partner secretion domain-containing protein n=1 Tax=Calothrix sp. NIES-3974 TaxID=2005462 RepID=UPI000B5F4796|nr:S-layer family protein [Calothrix sp. NIES-3974]BAZ06549.1 filamentous hemagglutinin outer membrane protein [Calothrix sp. NIES-3974]
MDYTKKSLGLLFVYTLGGLISPPVLAQATPGIIPDETLGQDASRIIPNISIKGENADLINGGLQREKNLFHSFREFNINQGQRVYFQNPPEVINILTRVTGSNPSNIFGRLGVDGIANLFLINPNGIIFGENASLDVRGSVVASTANGIKFGDQGFFDATNPTAPPLLTVNPSALIYHQINQNAAITNNSRSSAGLDPTNTFDTFGLRVGDGQSLLLVGGDVNINGGGLVAFGGKIGVAGIKGNGTIELNQSSGNLSLQIPSNVERGNIALTNRAGLLVTAGGGGDIHLIGKDITINNSRILAGILGGLGSFGIQAGNIQIDAQGLLRVDNNSRVFNSVNNQGLGNGGNILINAQNLQVNDGTQIGVLNFGEGNTGDLKINVDQTIDLDAGIQGRFTGLFAQLIRGKGTAGNIFIETGSLNIRQGAAIGSGTFGTGSVGKVEIKARDTVSLFGEGRSVIFNDVGFGGEGNSGGIKINTGSLFLSDKAVISSNVDGRGNSGGVDITARDLVSLDNAGEIAGGRIPETLILSRVNDEAEGNSGDISIKTGSLRISNSQITTSTASKGNSGSVIIDANQEVLLLRSADIFTEVTCACETESGQGGEGKGGDIRITTGSLVIDSGSNLRADTEAKGNAGDIVINARKRVVFSGSSKDFTTGAFTQVEPEAVGKGGNITINTPILSISGDNQINTRTQGQGDAGNIFINAESVTLDGADVRITSGATQRGRIAGTFGNGGDINIRARSLLVNNGAKIFADSELSDGSAGNIYIDSNKIRLNNNAIISANTRSANIIQEQAKINLNATAVILRRGSLISTNATGTNVVAGNININTGVLAGLENSDITANSADFRGGRVRITSQAILGIEARDFLTPESDITATGASASLAGTTEINTPSDDPIKGIIDLPNQILDKSDQIGGICPRGADAVKKIGEFTVTGRGGSLPPSLFEVFTGDIDTRELVNLPANLENTTGLSLQSSTQVLGEEKKSVGIVEAQGWIRRPDGRVVLVANLPHGSANFADRAVCLGNDG